MTLGIVCIKIMCFFFSTSFLCFPTGRDERSRCTNTFTHGFNGDGHEVEETLKVQI